MGKFFEYLFFLFINLAEKIDWLFKPVKSTNDDEIDAYLNSGKNSVRFMILSIFLMVIAALISTKDDVNKYGNFLNILNAIIYKVEFGLMIAALISFVASLIYSIRWLYLRWKLDIND